MTATEHETESARLLAALTRARKAEACAVALYAKVDCKLLVKQLEEQLRQHRLNYYELTGA